MGHRDELISIAEYAKMHGVEPNTVRKKILRGGYKTAVKIGRNWVISRNEPYTDKRKKEAGRMKTAKNLYELTGQESGITIYDDGRVIVCNWAASCQNGGLPHIAPTGKIIGWPPEELEVEEEWTSDDIRGELLGKEVVYDISGDVDEIFDADAPTAGRCYKIGGATVISPDGWI